MKAQLLEFSLYFRWFGQYWFDEKLRLSRVVHYEGTVTGV
jgi:hypothetical protein